MVLFCDEFTNYNDTRIGIEAIRLLNRLGYQVHMPTHKESGRAAISKGLLGKAQKIARQNVEQFHALITRQTPLVGIEPSAILCFRDEYPALLRGELQDKAKALAAHTLTMEEFISREADGGNITAAFFQTGKENIHYHGHCHQKALSSVNHTEKMLSLLPGRAVHAIECGCCGMAGSFGFEKNHYDLSMQIGELALFPAIRKTAPADTIVASGTSCRQQILEGTGRQAIHPIQALFRSLKATSV